MPVTQQSAAEMLAEFLQQRDVMVYRATRKQAKLERPEPIEKPEFEPDNSRIKRESRGMQSNPMNRVSIMMRSQVMMEAYPDAVAKAMVDEWIDAARGIVAPSFVVTVVNIDSDATIQSVARKPQYHGEWNVPVVYHSHNNSAVSTRMENESWEITRMPRTGQRPQVLQAK